VQAAVGIQRQHRIGLMLRSGGCRQCEILAERRAIQTAEPQVRAPVALVIPSDDQFAARVAGQRRVPLRDVVAETVPERPEPGLPVGAQRQMAARAAIAVVLPYQRHGRVRDRQTVTAGRVQMVKHGGAADRQVDDFGGMRVTTRHQDGARRQGTQSTAHE